MWEPRWDQLDIDHSLRFGRRRFGTHLAIWSSGNAGAQIFFRGLAVVATSGCLAVMGIEVAVVEGWLPNSPEAHVLNGTAALGVAAMLPWVFGAITTGAPWFVTAGPAGLVARRGMECPHFLITPPERIIRLRVESRWSGHRLVALLGGGRRCTVCTGDESDLRESCDLLQIQLGLAPRNTPMAQAPAKVPPATAFPAPSPFSDEPFPVPRKWARSYARLVRSWRAMYAADRRWFRRFIEGPPFHTRPRRLPRRQYRL